MGRVIALICQQLKYSAAQFLPYDKRPAIAGRLFQESNYELLFVFGSNGTNQEMNADGLRL